MTKSFFTKASFKKAAAAFLATGFVGAASAADIATAPMKCATDAIKAQAPNAKMLATPNAITAILASKDARHSDMLQISNISDTTMVVASATDVKAPNVSMAMHQVTISKDGKITDAPIAGAPNQAPPTADAKSAVKEAALALQKNWSACMSGAPMLPVKQLGAASPPAPTNK